ncbi:hypothetical protein [Labilibacter marinus]|uniref:hypothetical protein n=1 Tax=Labilibacter marinus TaxID=1477105 RepID=UPI00094F795F|nr:hypothetical protein [Labilibacter marinus]
MSNNVEINTIKPDNILVEASGKLIYSNCREKGKLILSNKHLKFTSKDGDIQQEFILSKISNVGIFKVLGFLKKGIKLSYNERYIMLFVKYPDDWIKLINKQLAVECAE